MQLKTGSKALIQYGICWDHSIMRHGKDMGLQKQESKHENHVLLTF